MKRTKEEADILLANAKVYIGRIWETQGKKYKFISQGVAISFVEKSQNDKKTIEENYQIQGVRLETAEGDKLNKTLEDIIKHFEKEDEKNKTS